ncbi:sigma-54 dependent transcriptional regulator [uncultured Umboniibacter sp.]|uniref:sigma-54-dependent transcriptional regulator n=1 Tax=uncultured Umboniibacter sp. TaxID=1798917 RepID=UPI002601F5EF|nr:sigma-54 dependent transcriptional regulator [uncultured Umboniibacter sp.]
MERVLIVDDNPAVLDSIGLLLELHGIESVGCDSPEAALTAVREQSIGVVIQDMNFSEDTTSGDEGVKLFGELRNLDTDLPIILLTGWADLETAVQLIQQGAADYQSKPWDDDKLVTSVRNLLEMRTLQADNIRLNAASRNRAKQLENIELCGTIVASSSLQSAVELAANVARSDVPVLITGPNGSGKEQLAQIVHANSERAAKPFVAVNMGALPDDLLEAELFGVVAGAFTGANQTREGRFSKADGGTLFLDEIGNLSHAGQMKLLRVLQTGEFEPLGSNETKRVHVRIVSATNADLPAAIQAGEFREDLYYRLNVIEVRLDGLADRKEDIIPLAKFFLQQDTLPKGVARALELHDWPGNVRELQNACSRAALLRGDGSFEVQHFGLEPPAIGAIEMSADDIKLALSDNDGVVAKAARSLGLSRQALYRRMEKLGIEN